MQQHPKWGTNNNNNIFAGQGSALLHTTSSTYDSIQYTAHTLVSARTTFAHQKNQRYHTKVAFRFQKDLFTSCGCAIARWSCFVHITSPLICIHWNCFKDAKENIWKAKKKKRNVEEKKINWFRRRKRCLHFAPSSMSIHRRVSMALVCVCFRAKGN